MDIKMNERKVIKLCTVLKDEGSDIEGEDNEEEGDTDHLDSEEEEVEKPTKFTGFTVKNKHG
jgi:hypothetical protein